MQQRCACPVFLYSVLLPELNCMRDLMRYYRRQFRYLINLTGQEFPLRTNLELVRIARIFNGSNDISGSMTRSSNYICQFHELILRVYPPSFGQTLWKKSKLQRSEDFSGFSSSRSQMQGEGLCDDDVHLFVCLLVCFSVRLFCRLWNLLSHSLRGSTWRERGLIVSSRISCY